MKILFGLVVCLISSSCMLFVPCPSSPSGYSHCGCLPPGITMYYQNQAQQEEQQTPESDIQIPSNNSRMNY